MKLHCFFFLLKTKENTKMVRSSEGISTFPYRGMPKCKGIRDGGGIDASPYNRSTISITI